MNADDEVLKNALRDNFSPEGIVMIESLLQMTSFYEPANAEARQALVQAECFMGILREMVGGKERGRILEELGM